MPDGLLLIDKPLGERSTDCVARIKRLWGRKVRVGHAGTLDSTASGLLVVLLGAATRLSDYVMRLPKTYTARLKLGEATDTCDFSGKVVLRGDANRVDAGALDRVLCAFWGTRAQRPPEVSALKLEGTPFHRLARAGSDARPLVRPVHVTSLQRISPVTEEGVEIAVVCGKGTYIRAIARDIGTLLGCGAHIAALRRLSIGPFRADEADERRLRPMRDIGRLFHRVLLTEDAERRLWSGLQVPLREAGLYVPGELALERELCVEGASMIGFAALVKGDRGWELKPKANVACPAEKETVLN